MSSLNKIGNVVSSATPIVNTLTTTIQNVYGVTVNKGKWLVIASLRCDGTGGRIFGSGFSHSVAVIGGGNGGDSSTVEIIGLCNVNADYTTIHAKYQCESGSRAIATGGMVAIQLT